MVTEVGFAKIFTTSNQHLTNFLIEDLLGYESCEFVILWFHDWVHFVESEKCVFQDKNELVHWVDTVLFTSCQAGTLRLNFTFWSAFLRSGITLSFLWNILAKLIVVVFKNFFRKRFSKDFQRKFVALHMTLHKLELSAENHLVSSGFKLYFHLLSIYRRTESSVRQLIVV